MDVASLRAVWNVLHDHVGVTNVGCCRLILKNNSTLQQITIFIVDVCLYSGSGSIQLNLLLNLQVEK